MLLKFKHRLVEGLLVAADVAGAALLGSGAAVVALVGKLMLAAVLAAVALGFLLRLIGRRHAQMATPVPVPRWIRGVAALLAAVEVALLVEATNFPVRFDQAGFETWHWALVVVALAIAYTLNLRVFRSLARTRRAASQP